MEPFGYLLSPGANSHRTTLLPLTRSFSAGLLAYGGTDATCQTAALADTSTTSRRGVSCV
jgi:hypothetical protein